MENDCKITIIKNMEDLAEYREHLETAKSSLSILMIPYLMGIEDDRDVLNQIHGEMVSLFRMMSFYKNNLGLEAFKLIYPTLMDKLYKEKIANMSKLLEEDYHITVNSQGGYTPVNK